MLLMISKSKIILPLLAACLAVVLFLYQQPNKIEGLDPFRIAHAGGNYGFITYSNSYEALEDNYKEGFRYFELDFVFTSDDVLVCLHDWKSNFKRSFGFTTKSPLSYNKFVDTVSANKKFKNCTLDGLAKWVSDNPDAYIVTDIKGDNLTGLKQLLKVIPDAKKKIIPQIYQPKNFKSVKELGFESIIWTLYRYDGNVDDVLDQIKDFSGKIAITMPTKRAKTNLPYELARLNIPSYVHTINSSKETSLYIEKMGVTEIYTDFMPATGLK
jgi:glycerophosphoryl diester phosphodiesterase